MIIFTKLADWIEAAEHDELSIALILVVLVIGLISALFFADAQVRPFIALITLLVLGISGVLLFIVFAPYGLKKLVRWYRDRA